MAKARILIVEDSFIVAYHLQTTLESEGYMVLDRCDSGEMALASVKKSTPDLVLMDIMLSGAMDGIQTASFIKLNYNIPVIYITALTDKDTISRAKITEPYGYLTKPFEDLEIFTVIEMALYKHDVEMRLVQSEEKYFSTVRSISDCVIAIDRDYRISYLNPSSEAVLQFTLNESVGKSIFDVLPLHNKVTGEVAVNPVQCPIGKGNFNRMPDDLVLTTRRGSQVPIGESSLSPLLDSKGNFVGLILIFKDLTERIEFEKMRQQLDRQRLAALIEGQERERARMAKDMHDGLGQMLSAIKINVSLAVKDPDEAENLSRLLNDTIQESIRISENLLPSKLRDFDLATCLRSLCMQVKKSTKSHVTFENYTDNFSLGQSQKVNLYRIAQEAINNAVKHSKAEHISMQLGIDEGSLQLCIEDNGIGFRKTSNGTSGVHHGLINMQERAEILGGTLTIESDARRGTMVIVEVPVTRLAANEEN